MKRVKTSKPKDDGRSFDDDTKYKDHLDKNKLKWETVDTQGNSVQICYDFNTERGCDKGDECPRAHKCVVASCSKEHSMWEHHPNFRPLMASFFKGGKGRGKGKGKGKGKNKK